MGSKYLGKQWVLTKHSVHFECECGYSYNQTINNVKLFNRIKRLHIRKCDKKKDDDDDDEDSD